MTALFLYLPVGPGTLPPHGGGVASLDTAEQVPPPEEYRNKSPYRSAEEEAELRWRHEKAKGTLHIRPRSSGRLGLGRASGLDRGARPERRPGPCVVGPRAGRRRGVPMPHRQGLARRPVRRLLRAAQPLRQSPLSGLRAPAFRASHRAVRPGRPRLRAGRVLGADAPQRAAGRARPGHRRAERRPGPSAPLAADARSSGRRDQPGDALPGREQDVEPTRQPPHGRPLDRPPRDAGGLAGRHLRRSTTSTSTSGRQGRPAAQVSSSARRPGPLARGLSGRQLGLGPSRARRPGIRGAPRRPGARS